MDKRIIRTRTAVFNAVFELATEKELDRISVVELCDRAGINKSTFYLHYKSLNDCFQKCFNLFTDKILEYAKTIDYNTMADEPEETIKRLLDAAETNKIYVERFRDSVFYDNAIKNLKIQFVKTVCETNGINLTDNYHEVAKVTFLVGGCADILITFSANYKRAEIEKMLVDIIKRK